MQAVRIGLAVLLLSAGSVHSEESRSFNSIAGGCRSLINNDDKSYFMQGLCAGVIDGIMWAHPNICPPTDSILSQGVRVVLNYANKFPEKWHEDRNKIIQEALLQVWSCRR